MRLMLYMPYLEKISTNGRCAMLETSEVLILYALWFPFALGLAVVLLKMNS